VIFGAEKIARHLLPSRNLGLTRDAAEPMLIAPRGKTPDPTPPLRAVNRRDFLQLGAAAAGLAPLLARGANPINVDDHRSIAELTSHYLTPQLEFNTVERGGPGGPIRSRSRNGARVGLERETWQLEVIVDPQSNAVLGKTADQGRRHRLHVGCADAPRGEKKATRYLKGDHLQQSRRAARHGPVGRRAAA